MKNDTIWNFANDFFTKQLLQYAGFSLAAAILFVYLGKEVTWQPMAIMLLSLAVAVIKTEQELSRNFDDDGNKK